MTTLAHQRLVKPLVDSLGRLPLHGKTLDLLESKLAGGTAKNAVVPLAQLVSGYESSRAPSQQSKALESLIYYAHFVLGSPTPLHLKMFQSHYTDMLLFWPYERHRTILNMEKPKVTSLRYQWDDCRRNVLSSMQYSRNPWFEDSSPSGKLTNLQRDLLFHSVFSHYLFLKIHHRLCKNGRSLPIPIVEIQMRPLGNDIAASRIRNQFKAKVAQTYRILAVDNPALSPESEALLGEIISSTPTRKLRRLYQTAIKRAYVIEHDDEDYDNKLSLPRFRPSSLLLNI